MLKNTLLFILFIFCTYCAKAQSQTKSQLTGIWELDGPKIKTSNGQEAVLIHHLKIFSTDGGFQTIVLSPTVRKISHSGKYVILDHEFYNEVIANQSQDANGKLAGKTYKLHYQFLDNNNKLHLQGTVESNTGGNAIKVDEIWKRVK